ncbi:MAG: uroporphyrinogen-III synthase [Gemmatimonadetes bacterium]|nr:uroporphyrinogen-III synthase [Gemmatimonadota bacterium]
MTPEPVIVITRPERDGARTAAFLEEHGFRSLIKPLIETRKIEPAEEDRRALLACDWVLVTSRNAARALSALLASDQGGEGPPSFSVAAIHEGSAAALAEAGIPPDRVLHAPNADSAARALVRDTARRPLRIGYPCSLQADTAWTTTDALSDVEIVRVPLYSTEPTDAGAPETRAFWEAEEFDCVLVASPTAARALHAIRPIAGFDSEIAFAAIGRTTAGCLRELGRSPAIVPAEPTMPALADALIHWRDARRRS